MKLLQAQFSDFMPMPWQGLLLLLSIIVVVQLITNRIIKNRVTNEIQRAVIVLGVGVISFVIGVFVVGWVFDMSFGEMIRNIFPVL